MNVEEHTFDLSNPAAIPMAVLRTVSEMLARVEINPLMSRQEFVNLLSEQFTVEPAEGKHLRISQQRAEGIIRYKGTQKHFFMARDRFRYLRRRQSQRNR
jgi:hypothetical protein